MARFGQQLVDRLARAPGHRVGRRRRRAADCRVPSRARRSSSTASRPRPDGSRRSSGIRRSRRASSGRCGSRMLRGRDFDATRASRGRALGDRQRGARRSVLARPGSDRQAAAARPAMRPRRSPWSTVVGVVASVRQGELREPLRPADLFPARASATAGRRARSPTSFADRTSPPQADAARRAVWSIDRDLPIAGDPDDGRGRRPLGGAVLLHDVHARALGARRAGRSAPSVSTACCPTPSACARARSASASRSARRRRGSCARWWRTARCWRAWASSSARSARSALTRLLEGLLFEVEPLDLATFTLMPALLLVVALLASYLPARRAAAVSPLEAMRGE